MSNEKVGYKKPPKKGQFKKGKSGNPRGRRKESRNVRNVLEDALAETVAVQEGGKKRRISKLEAMIKQQVNLAAKGDPRAFQQLQRLILLIEGPGLLDARKEPLPWNDEEIV